MQQYKTRSADGTHLQLYRWNEKGETDLFLIHSYAQHSLRLRECAEFFSENGYRVTAMDLRGHGLSGGRIGHTDMWLRYTEDILAGISTIGRPFYTLAHGMGGVAMLRTMQGSIAPRLKGVILSNPILGLVRPIGRIQQRLLSGLSKLRPHQTVKMQFSERHLARNPALIESYQSDPLCFDFMTLGWARQFLRAMPAVMRHAQLYTYPMLLIGSQNDSIAAAPATQEFAKKYGSQIDFKVFERHYHAILEDDEKEDVFHTIATWISNRESP
ncbi:MAG: alpha/beta hydrolase [Myxococcota bacterium]|nr:alpha/beta hydrolase [Myxococcota bacterium]